ncbi:hypothetical protein [Nitrosopumilus ureiphilus]|nr:hypothetical protein [Nitrosopumilus ureiphilus]
MKSIILLHKSHLVGEESTKPTFFPRIIREFDDNEKPMMYGDE